MATAEELLAQMEENPELYTDSIGPVNDVIVINAEERTIELPESEKKFGTESDKKSERKHFKCPRIVGDNIDLSALNLSINFKNANNEADIYPIEDVEVDGDYITFSWLLSKKVTAYKTDASENQLLSFIFCAKSGEDPDVAWNTTLCSDGVVLEGLEPGESIAEDNPDIIQYILERLESAGTITPEQISEAVEGYLASNPIEETDPTVPAWAKEEAPDKSLTQEGKAADAKEVGDRLSELSDEVEELTKELNGKLESNTGSGAGWNATQINILENIGQYVLYSDTTTGQTLWDSLIASLRSGAGSDGGSGDNTGGDSSGEDSEGTTTTWTITNSFANVTTDNTAATVDAGANYTATLTADNNYYIDSVVITMSGVNITTSVYADGVITIPEVTGNVVIVAKGTASDNLITAEVLAECGAGGLPDGSSADGTTMLVTPFIEVEPTIYYYNFVRTLPSGSKLYNQKICCYDENQTYISGALYSATDGTNGIGNVDLSLDKYSGVKYVRCLFSAEWTNPYFGKSGVVV